MTSKTPIFKNDYVFYYYKKAPTKIHYNNKNLELSGVPKLEKGCLSKIKKIDKYIFNFRISLQRYAWGNLIDDGHFPNKVFEEYEEANQFGYQKRRAGSWHTIDISAYEVMNYDDRYIFIYRMPTQYTDGYKKRIFKRLNVTSEHTCLKCFRRPSNLYFSLNEDINIDKLSDFSQIGRYNEFIIE